MRKKIINRAAWLFLFMAVSMAQSLYFSPEALAQTIDSNFNPNYIISDLEILDSNSMDQDDIQEFLLLKGSFLAGYKVNSCTSDDLLNAAACSGPAMTAAQIIYDRAIANSINPKFLLVLLQKEQGLIEDSSPSQSQLDWATGYGCPDNSSPNPRWKGLWKQINSASLQFRDYLDNPQLYTYKAGVTYTFTNPYGTVSNEPMSVTPANQATAALYNYTPHVFNGNYNFYKLWLKYFVRNYPDGSLLQVSGESVVWLIKSGNKRPFTSRGALTSRYDINKVIMVAKSDIDKYPAGDPIKFSQYSLVRSPKGTVYLLVDDTRRGFASREALRKTGINPEEIIDVTFNDLAPFREIAPITATSTYATGALLQDPKTGGVFYVIDNTKAPIWDRIFLTTKFKTKTIQRAAKGELDKYQTAAPVKFDDGELLKSSSSPGVYLISNGLRRAFTSGEVFEKMGYKWNNVITASQKVLDLYPDGELISQVNN
ncbi:MAG: hypothetical protein WCW77_03850 [Patescibacteria group bacterium]|jgi:hypothetical protein